jgi:hypothetical protein
MENRYSPAQEVYGSFSLGLDFNKPDFEDNLKQDEMDKYLFFREDR